MVDSKSLIDRRDMRKGCRNSPSKLRLRYPRWVEKRVSRALLLAVAGALVAGALIAPAAESGQSATPTIVVTFNTNGVVTAALNGTPLGTTSGAPTVIPGGYYSVLLNGPGDCINLPLFELSGPGVNIQDDMLGGEVDTHSLPTYFLPNATYTWHIDRNQSIVYTFRTSSDVVGAATTTGSSSTSSKGGTSRPRKTSSARRSLPSAARSPGS